MIKEKRIRVLVCGVTFGKMYINAILASNEKFELSGILSSGSKASKILAERYNVPLYTNVDDIPVDKFDLACVVIRSTVVGGKGTEIALNLLEKGISVIQEQPVHYNDMIKCLRTAYKKKVLYYINNFYRDLDSVRKMFKTVKEVGINSKILSIEASSSVQVLFPLVDILGEILDGFADWQFSEKINSNNYPYSIITGHAHDIPIVLQIQNHINSQSPDSDALVLHRIVITFDTGTLILTDSNGCLIWIPRICVIRGDLEKDLPNSIKEYPPYQVIYNQPVNTLQEIYQYCWPKSIQNTLERIYVRLINKTIDNKVDQRQIVSCKVWAELGNILGVSEEIPESIKYKKSLYLNN
jgi:thiazolinyl imide reductase